MYYRSASVRGSPSYGDHMQNKDEVKDFLLSRRNRVTPERVELPGVPAVASPGFVALK